jgi:alpha-glucosidase
VPIPWSGSSPNFGNGSGKPTHLPQPEWFKDYTVESEQGKEGSTLEMYKKALKLRRELLRGSEEDLEWVKDKEDAEVLHFKRQGGWEVIMNFDASEPVEIPQGAEVLVQSGELEGGKVGKETTVWLKRA